MADEADRDEAGGGPGWVAFAVAFVVAVTMTVWLRSLDPRPGPMAWYAAIAWTAPVVVTVQGVAGALVVRFGRREAVDRSIPPEAPELLIVTIPTIGRHDTVPALLRVVANLTQNLPPHFPRMRADIYVEEHAEALDEIRALSTKYRQVRVIEIPAFYRTPRGTAFKARANHFAHMKRAAEHEAGSDVWLLHMDDDTGIGPGTAAAIARFVGAQRSAGEYALHLGQGVLAYPREHAGNRLIWLADAIRPGCDISIFAASTGSGTPYAGLHGELLLVRASAEAEIGWDFGPMTLVEDAHFALHFSQRFPGRSGWFAGRSHGATPQTVGDFVRQRERWVWGLLHLVAQPSIPLRRRLPIIMNVTIWSYSPFCYPGVLLGVGLLLSDGDTTPPSLAVGVVWSINFAFYIWLYWEGFRINVDASAVPHSRLWERVAVIAATPLFAVWECVGIARGIGQFLVRSEPHFSVIAKPR